MKPPSSILNIWKRPPDCVRRMLGCWLIVVGLAAVPMRLAAQAVIVTLKPDASRIGVGQTTLVRVFGRIAPTQRAASERIFSFHVDVLNGDAQIASLDYSKLQMPKADNDPLTTSTGISDGPLRRGIMGTFLNLPGAGRDVDVELFSVPITGLLAGSVTVRVQPGSTADFGPDFLVAPATGGEAFTGGDYAGAEAAIEVSGESPSSCGPVAISIRQNTDAAGKLQFTVSFAPCFPWKHTVEFTDSLVNPVWQALPGAPHDSGVATDSPPASQRFYRLRMER
jgi:hypothetical protein